jgi:hypothetical protein
MSAEGTGSLFGRRSLSGRSPCFAMCGDPICEDHGCRHVYQSRPRPEPMLKVYVVFSIGSGQA